MATVVASIYYWQYRFDLVPAALIVLGLLLAHKQRWGWSGIILGIGAAVKWTPARSFLLLSIWLVAGRRRAALERVVSGFLGSVLLIHVPFLLWQPDRVLSAYATQDERGTTNESVWFFPLSLLGVIGDTEEPFAPAGAPQWADVLAVTVQAVVLLGLIALAWLHRERAGPALVLAALAPVVFLVTNRIFSPQFLLVLIAALAFAGALVVRNRYGQLVLGGLLIAAAFANAFVYPFRPELGPRAWQPYSAAVFATIVAAIGVVLFSALPRANSVEDRSPDSPSSEKDP